MESAARTIFIIAVATLRVIFPGIETPALPGGEQIPPFGTAHKQVAMELTSSAEVDAPSASVTVPAGLGIGSSVKLTVEKPAADTGDAAEADGNPKAVETRLYWGSHENVPQGQPRILKSDAAETPAQSGTDSSPSHGTWAFWPGYDDDPLRPQASAAGDYTLQSNFCSAAKVTVAEDQNFLNPITLLTPKSEPDWQKPVKIEWEAVPNAVGYLLSAVGSRDGQVIVWTSGAAPDSAAEVIERPVAADEIEMLLEQKVLLPADATSCWIPAGAFAGAKNVMLTITALGRDSVQEKDSVDTAVIVRSAAHVMLSTKSN